MVKTNKIILVISSLVILFSINLCGCSNEQADMESEQNDIEIIEEQYIAEEDLQDSVQVSLEQERIIQDQSFTVELDDWGSVGFVSYKPGRNIGFDDVSFYLVKDNQVIYEFPYYCEDNNTRNYIGLFDGVEAVGFRDFNNDGKDDIVVIIDYVTGAGPQGMIPRPTARIFLAEEKGFYVAEDMMTDVSDHIAEKDLTVDNVYQYILSKDVENSTAEVYESGENKNSTQLYAKYSEVLMQILTDRTDPNGKYFDDGSQGVDFSRNCFAITDIDGDGRDELMFPTNYEGEVFPSELDTDGDNLLFFVGFFKDGTDDVERTYMNCEEFEAWEQTMFPDEYEIDIKYHHMTEEEIENIKTVYL